MLDINKAMDEDDFIRLAIEWNQNSPYMANRVEGIDWHGEKDIRFGTSTCWLDIKKYHDVIAIRHEVHRESKIWDTDLCMNFRERRLAIRLDRSYLEDSFSDNAKFSAPFFIKLLIDHKYLKQDNGLPVSHLPIPVKMDNLELISDLITGRKRYKLPVIFASRAYNNRTAVDVPDLAWRLKGVAHVLVQESPDSYYKLRSLCEGQNEYDGAIGIYFPGPADPHKKFLYRGYSKYDAFMTERIVQTILQYSNVQRLDPLYTWQGVSSAYLKEKLSSQLARCAAAESAQREAEQATAKLINTLDEEERRIRRLAVDEATREAEKLLDEFDEDNRKLQRQIEEMARENESLRFENLGLKSKLDSKDSVPLLYSGEEYDLYQGEIKDLVLSVLTDAIGNLPENSRRLHVISDIVQSNGYEKQSEQRIAEVKRLLKSYTGMTARLRQSLESLGFGIKEEGKHYKLTYYDDGRNTIVIPKTPSDIRSGPNCAGNIIRLLF